MRRAFILLMLALIAGLGFVSAEFDLNVNVIDKGSVIISELKNPAVYDLEVTNNQGDDFAEIYSLVSVSMAPKGTFKIPAGNSTVEVRAYPGEDFRKRDGIYSFEYQIKGERNGIYKGKLSFRVVYLRDSISLGEAKIHPNDNVANLTVKNRLNAHLENLKIHFKSEFFDSVKIISLKPFEETGIEVEISNKPPSLLAGIYQMSAEVEINGASEKFESEIKYLEKEGTSIVKESSGILIRQTAITKTNEGNVPVRASIEIRKDIVSRLFTSFSEEPRTSERGGLVVKYVWEKNLQPGESYSISSRTNYTFPFVVLVLIIIIAFLVRVYGMTAVALNKKVHFVKTKGGEFALRVVLDLKARKNITNVQIIDKLPINASLYEQYGKKPDKIDEKTGQLIWNISRLNRGEERVFSYIIYSKLKIVGRFELPSAVARFESEGKKAETLSNKAYFVSEFGDVRS